MCVFKIEEDPFNPDYVEVDRVLEVSYCEDKDTGEVAIALCLFMRAGTSHKSQSLLFVFVVAGGVLFGEMVLTAIRGQHMGAEGRC